MRALVAAVSGFEKFETWLPQVLVDLINPHASVASVTARAALSHAISVTLVVLAALLAVGVVGGMRNVLAGRSHHLRTGRFLGLVRKLAALAVIGLPWWSVWQIFDVGVPVEDVDVGVFLAACVWILAVVTDHGHVWHERGAKAVVLRSGFAIFRTTRTRIQLDKAVLWAGNREPVGDQLGRSVTSGRLPKVTMDPQAWKALSDGLGRDVALAWLEPLLRGYGLRLQVKALALPTAGTD